MSEFDKIFDKLDVIGKDVAVVQSQGRRMEKDIKDIKEQSMTKELCEERHGALSSAMDEKIAAHQPVVNGVSSKTMWSIIAIFAGLVLTVLVIAISF